MAEQPATRQGGRLSCRVAPPFTLENVYEAVRRVRDWRKFGGLLLDFIGNKLDAIHRQHSDNVEGCLKAVIEAFLRGEGRQPSWRRVIWALYWVGENHIAHDIIAFAEPVEDPTMTVDAVTQVMDKIQGDKWTVMRWGLGIPEPLVVEILQRNYSSSSEESHAIASAYVNINPDASWKYLTAGLYGREEFAAARTSKTFMSTDPTFTIDNVTRVMKKIELEKREKVWKSLLMHDFILETIQQHYSAEERESASIDIYIKCTSWSSWEHLAKELYHHHQVAAVDEIKSYLPPRAVKVSQPGGSSTGPVVSPPTGSVTEMHQEGSATSPEVAPPADTGCLTIEDLSDVMVAAWEARVEWYNIGLCLRISADDLDTIQKDHRDTKPCYIAMLKVWLRNKPHPSWTKLVEALRSPVVGYEDLADKLASRTT